MSYTTPPRRREGAVEGEDSPPSGGSRTFNLALVFLLALGIWIVAPGSPTVLNGRRAAALTPAEEDAAVLADLLRYPEPGEWDAEEEDYAEEQENGGFAETGRPHQRRRARATVLRNGKRPETAVIPSEFTPAHMRAAAALAEQGFLWAPVAMDLKPTDEESRIQYCRLNITAYHAEPWLYPMARQLLEVSGCTARGGVRTYTLSSVRATIEAYPEEFLEPTALLFHETRCGSTLAANMLAAVPTNLVHSEAAVTVQALAVAGISPLRAVDVTRLVMKAMSPRVGGHTHSFFKLQSSRFVRELSAAWPKAPWVYFFRDPLEVMVSNLKGQWMRRSQGGQGGAYLLSCPCVRGVARERVYKARRRRPELAGKPLQPEELEELKLEDACREHLDGLNSRALCQLSQERAAVSCPPAERGGNCAATRGVAVEYTEMPGVFTEKVYPDHLGMRSAMEANPGGHLPHLLRAAEHYSKQASSPGNVTVERELEMFQVDERFKTGMDQDTKAAGANERMRAAAAGMCGSYHTLRLWQRWHASSSSAYGLAGSGAPPGPTCGPDVDAATALAWGDLGEAELCPRSAGPGAAWRKNRERRLLSGDDGGGGGGGSSSEEGGWSGSPAASGGAVVPLWQNSEGGSGSCSSSAASSWGSSGSRFCWNPVVSTKGKGRANAGVAGDRRGRLLPGERRDGAPGATATRLV